jgi:cytochrome c5
MKKIVKVSVAVLCFLFLTAGIANNVRAQSEQKDSIQSMPIPPDVMKIIEKSCTNCHSEPGKKLALTHVNLSKWDQYSLAKQAGKAQAMCKEVTNGKMPPKSYKEDHPEAFPNAEEIKIICDWAQSIQIPEK